jgi:hypothetical protein
MLRPKTHALPIGSKHRLFHSQNFAHHQHDFLGIENHIAGNKTFLSGVVYLVVEEGVCFQRREAAISPERRGT